MSIEFGLAICAVILIGCIITWMAIEALSKSKGDIE